MNRTQIVGAWVACMLLPAGCDREPATTATSRPTESAAARKPAAATAPAGPIADRDVDARVIAIVGEQMAVRTSELSRRTSLKGDLKTDDLDNVELVMELEDAFELLIPDEDAEKFQTIGDMIDYVRTHRGKAR